MVTRGLIPLCVVPVGVARKRPGKTGAAELTTLGGGCSVRRSPETSFYDAAEEKASPLVTTTQYAKASLEARRSKRSGAAPS